MSAKQNIDKAIVDLLLVDGFLSSVTLRLPITFVQNVPIAATDGEQFLFNEKGMETVCTNERLTLFVILHELVHVMLKHPMRMKLSGYHPMICNIAMDHEVNLFLEEYLEHLKGTCSRAIYEVPDWCLKDRKYKGMVFEEIVRDVAKHVKPPPPLPQGGGQGQGKGQAGGGQPGEGDALGKRPGEGGMDVQGFKGDQAKQAHQEQMIDSWVEYAAQTQKQKGTLPGCADRMIKDLRDPKIPWQDILRDNTGRIARDDYSWTRPNKRYSTSNVVVPSLYSRRVGWVVVARDTSGSISAEELNNATSEAVSILEDVKPGRFTLIDCDASIARYEDLDEDSDTNWKGKGGGGTSFVPVFDRIKKEDEEPVMLVYFTDGYGDWEGIPEPPYPVLWVMSTDLTPPWGQHARL